MSKGEHLDSSVKVISVPEGANKSKVRPYWLRISLLLTLGVLAWLVLMPQREPELSAPPKSQLAALNEALKSDESAKLVVPFVKNLGQYADAGVKYSASIFKGAVYVKDTGVVYALAVPRKTEEKTEEKVGALGML